MTSQSQFTTLQEAQQIARELGNIGGGVRPYNAETALEQRTPDADDDQASGIYIPLYAGPFSTPHDGDAQFFHLRFRNGAEGFNAGLVKRTMEFAPTRWPSMIAAEVNAAARH